MTDPGLTRRLRQQGHRSGLAIGISMALAIAVLFGGFTWIYVQLDPWARDFAGAEPAPTQTPREAASNSGGRATRTPTPEEDTSPEDQPADAPAATETPKPESTRIQAVNEDKNDFKPDYQVVALEPVRLRSGPGVNFDIVVDGVPPGTQLQYLDDREPSQNPDADGDTEWLKFRLESGEEGWIRNIDVGGT